MPRKTIFPPVRACIFDMDGLLLDTEDKYTECVNRVLSKYGRPNLPWSIKAQLQGRPAVEANKIFLDWAKLPITEKEYVAELAVHQHELFPRSAPLPGVEKLLRDLYGTRDLNDNREFNYLLNAPEDYPEPQPHKVRLAVATSSSRPYFALKTMNLPPDLFGVFDARLIVTGDDERVPAGHGKPLPHIYLAALKAINETNRSNPVSPSECLVFEDSVPGVEAARRAGMRVVWCPHPMLEREFHDRHAEVLAGLTRVEAADFEGHILNQLGSGWVQYMRDLNVMWDDYLPSLDDGWGEYMPSLEDFPYAKYGIILAGKDVSPSEE